MKKVSDRSNVSAYVVLKKGKLIATVNFLFTPSAVRCDVYQGHELTHQSKAGGYGYDKLTAAIAGAVIDGIKIANHCGHSDAASEKKRASLLKAYRKRIENGTPTTTEERDSFTAKASKIGCRFSNYNTRDGVEGYTSLYFVPGLERLEYLGYTVTCVI